MIEYIGILCFFLSGIMVGMALKECGEEINQLLKDKKALEAERIQLQENLDASNATWFKLGIAQCETIKRHLEVR